MSTPIIISICVLLLLAYAFDFTASITKIPTVILLLILGWTVKEITNIFQVELPNLTPALPILGTVGLILIVLEGSLELELHRKKLPLVAKSTFIALVPMLLFSFGLAYAFNYYGNVGMKIGLANAIPLAIISSAIAIPSAQYLSTKNKEFVTYESSLSDIFGVIFFNFVIYNDTISGQSLGQFLLQLFLMLFITFISTLGLALLLSKIKHHVKFAPIILIIILIYAIAKIYHLPALIFILLFGLFLGNLDELKHLSFIKKLHPEILQNEVNKFKELTTEMAFLIRSLFFLVFGYLIELEELLNSKTIVWALVITGSIFVLRFVMLKSFRFSARPLLFIAPRGLITILLFLSIPITQSTHLANKSLVIQVIILTALVMMFGLITNKKPTESKINVDF